MMALETKFVIKICGITNEQDARDAVQAGATALGFNFYRKSPRYVTVEQAQVIAASLPAAVLRVGVFVNETAESIAETACYVPLDVVQLHGRMPNPLPQLRIWRAIAVDENFDPGQLSGIDVDAFLLDAPTDRFGGSGRSFDWVRAAGLKRRILLAGGLDGSNVEQGIAAVDPWGVDACSRIESSPGKKDARKVREFVAAARKPFEARDRRSASPVKQEISL
ncbi:MAG TPA: phosphoribosylanthranilate isomerase [Bryobacteraceae bacterium]|jgi:phosphoribosylanthranilate isomerase|nr:phosphoribosylanthranilate isomerase [Bryobacteraceae bacterium]